jgi:hypothetical protein
LEAEVVVTIGAILSSLLVHLHLPEGISLLSVLAHVAQELVPWHVAAERRRLVVAIVAAAGE